MKHLADFPNAVLTGVDSAGYPFSVRCKPEPDAGAQVLRVQLPDGTGIQPGPAGLLYHRHDEWLWNLKSFVVRGTLELDDRGWILRAQQFIPGAGVGGWLGKMQFLRMGRRNTKRYLERRGLPRPNIPWDEIEALWAQVNSEKQIRRQTHHRRSSE